MSEPPPPSSTPTPLTPALPPVTLILGGARSGKSAHAEALVAAAGGGAGTYLATAEAGDGEMRERIRRHRDRRGPLWHTIEEPLALPAALPVAAAGGRPVLVDCLTLWLANLMAAGRSPETEAALLTQALVAIGQPVVFVSNEVGLGIVPDNALARAFRDAAGSLNQRIAAAAQRVVFVAAGLPLTLKDQR